MIEWWVTIGAAESRRCLNVGDTECGERRLTEQCPTGTKLTCRVTDHEMREAEINFKLWMVVASHDNDTTN
eukprot:scaffold538774_cov24-Prasinocladus_malaysianus.AAC.1